MKADKLLQKAFAIASKEQVVAIARAHLLFEKGEKQTAEKILDSALAMKDGGRDNISGDVVESETIVRGRTKIFGEFDVV